jgi:general stress protein YciG
MTIQPIILSRAGRRSRFRRDGPEESKKRSPVAVASRRRPLAPRIGFSPEEARQAGRKGGEAVSGNRQHMASIGRRGGVARHALRKAQEAGRARGQVDAVKQWQAGDDLPVSQP